MKTIKITLACMMIAAVAVVISCKKNDSTTPTTVTTTTADSDVSGAKDNTLAENTSNDIVQIGSEASDANGHNPNLNNFRLIDPEEELTSCALVVRDTIADTISVTFLGTTCLDGRVRTGSLTFNYHNSSPGAIYYRDPGFTFTVTSHNYTVDSNQVIILNKTVTNTTIATGLDFNPANVNETWGISATIEIVKPNTDTITWTCDRVKTLLNTSDPTVYHGDSANSVHISWDKARIGITGNASGKRSLENENFLVNVTNQLVRDFTCHPGGKVPFIQGTFTYTASTKVYPRVIDYGNGDCDLDATVTINGHTYPITLP